MSIALRRERFQELLKPRGPEVVAGTALGMAV
jgi:hypothetical protein